MQAQGFFEHLRGFVGAAGEAEHLGQPHPRVRAVDEEVGPVQERHGLARQPLPFFNTSQLGDCPRSRTARNSDLDGEGRIQLLYR
jgi:hypothetical protein